VCLCLSTHHLAAPTASDRRHLTSLHSGRPEGLPRCGTHSRLAWARTVHLTKIARAYPPWSRRGIIPMCDGLSTSRFRFFNFFCGPGGMNSGRNLKALLLSPCIFQYYTPPVVGSQVQSAQEIRTRKGRPPKPPPPADKYYSAFADQVFSTSWAVRCSGSPWRPREGRSGATARIPPFRSRNSLTLGPTLSCWKQGSETD